MTPSDVNDTINVILIYWCPTNGTLCRYIACILKTFCLNKLLSQRSHKQQTIC